MEGFFEKEGHFLCLIDGAQYAFATSAGNA